jgi:hypothetical protein
MRNDNSWIRCSAVRPGSASLALLTVAAKLISDHVRAIPLVAWLLYCWGLLLLNPSWCERPGFGSPTWSLVRDLPTVSSPAAVVHPVLEGVFNIVLCWAGLFVGFISDGLAKQGRESDSPPFLPYAVAMHFFTNAALLPHLISRASSADRIYKEDLTFPERVGETRLAPAVLVGVCWASVLWGLHARPESANLAEGYTTFSARSACPSHFSCFWVFQS